ncbi:hypothetical protein CDL15_Pgr013812 [Punica granatum]|uniref:NB-ARC domain-containing protein n=1 Tax=Punica granatum TaxID=22663 RepID=A0A218W1G6_PUNGR|nr:hypothetical protein CDL15_Pgr013812 [Punica granatum]
MDLPIYSPGQSICDWTTLEALMDDFDSVMDFQPHVDPSNSNDDQDVLSPSSPANPQHAAEQQDMLAPASVHEQVLNTGGDNLGLQSTLLPNSPDLPRERPQEDAMQVDQDPCSERDQCAGAAFPQPSIELTRDAPDSGGDAILAPGLVGQVFDRVLNEIMNYHTSDIVLQQHNSHTEPSTSCHANHQHAVVQQDIPASNSIHELVVNVSGENSRGMLPNCPDLPEECHQADAMEVDQDPFLVLELVGQESNRIVNEIWNHIRKDDILHVGIYGMPGVGKTTTVMHLYNKVHASAAFNNVFWVAVSKHCSIHELQNKITLAVEVPNLFKDVDEVRRSTLSNHLSKKRKSPIILDDMWQHFEIKEVRIPVMKDGIQLLLTARDRGVCEKMLCQQTITVQTLSEEEALMLFVGTLGNDLSLSRELIAKSILEECNGLPLAIIVMAEA